MAKYLTLTLDLLIYDASVPTNDPADKDALRKTIQDQSITLNSRNNPVPVPNSAVDQAIALPANPSNYLVIAVDQTVTVKVNGSPAMTLRPKNPGVKTIAFYMCGDITSLTVSNSSGATANLDVIAAKI